MNEGGRRALLFAILFAGFVIHAAFGGLMRIHTATPNLALTVLLIECLYIGPALGAVLGFFLGLLEGSLIAFYVGSFIVSRSLLGFAVGALEERIFRDNVFVAVAMVIVGTAVGETLFFLFAPQPNVPRWAWRVLLESLYNGALAIPLYLLLRRLIRPLSSRNQASSLKA